MKTILVLGAGMLLGGVSVIAFRPSPDSSVPSSSPREAAARSVKPITAPVEASRHASKREEFPSDSPSTSRPTTTIGGGAVTRMLAEREAAKQQGADAAVSRQELATRAAKVEFEANRRLEQWTRDLNLTEEQQDQAFAILVRASDAYHPALAVEGVAEVSEVTEVSESVGIATGEIVSAPRSVEGQLEEIIDPSQQDQLVEDLANRELWWDDVVSYLEADLDASTAAAEAAAAAAAAPTPSDYQGDDLSDLFGN